MSSFNHNLPAPRRITASNLPLASDHSHQTAEPGVEVKVDTLECQPLMDGSLVRAVVATEKQVPTSNDGHGEIPLDEVPGMGIVLPGGVNMYYLDVAPNTEGTMVSIPSPPPYYLDRLPSRRLGLLDPLDPTARRLPHRGGKSTHRAPVATLCKPGDIVSQRGIMHALSNRTNEWVRVLAVVLGSDANKVPIGQSGGHKELADQWLA
ncbi:hypothetical protein PG996_005603 [Apiospora saccharicola]|uniref:Uncharacterized protein n=1 Tax=Apiospora saccharicola TaxID=335842 RepID=A0ABR1VLZ4_9PEZI